MEFERVEGSRITALEQAFAEQGNAAIEAFWAEVESAGTPLIEPLPSDDAYSLVTFLWRHEGSEDTVGLLHGPVTAGDLQPLTRLSGSNVSHLTYRVPNDLRNAYWLITAPPRSLWPESQAEFDAIQERRQQPNFLRLDPLNRHQRPQRTDPLDPRTESPGHSIVELPSAQRLPFDDSRSNIARGQLTEHRFVSSRLVPERRLWVYTPAGIDSLDSPCDVLVMFDGHRAIDEMGVPAMLDHLIADQRLRPTVAVFIESLFESRHVELPCYEPFAEFLAVELMPWLTANYPVTDNPARTTLAGASYGALAASYGALLHPERFGNVLAQSGSFSWEPIDREERYISPEEREGGWLISEYGSKPAVPVRFYLDAGLLEHHDRHLSLRNSVRDFRDVLQSRGYEVTHQEFNGGHAFGCWRFTFPDGLLSLVGVTSATNDAR